MPSMYTVYRCRSKSSDVRKGHLHYSHDGETTLCGHQLDHMWFIDDNTFEGNATCPQCRQLDINPSNPDTSVAYWKAHYLDLLNHCKECISDSELVKSGDTYKIMLPYRFVHLVEASEKLLSPNDWRNKACAMMAGEDIDDER